MDFKEAKPRSEDKIESHSCHQQLDPVFLLLVTEIEGKSPPAGVSSQQPGWQSWTQHPGNSKH